MPSVGVEPTRGLSSPMVEAEERELLLLKPIGEPLLLRSLPVLVYFP